MTGWVWVDPLCSAEARGEPIEIWFQDEARIGQKGMLAYVWARRGTRPRPVQDTRYASD